LIEETILREIWGGKEKEKEEEEKINRDPGRVRRFTYNSRRWRPVERVVCTGGDAPGSGIVAATSHDAVGIDAKESVATKTPAPRASERARREKRASEGSRHAPRGGGEAEGWMNKATTDFLLIHPFIHSFNGWTNPPPLIRFWVTSTGTRN
jgi:hypothetical protein